MESILIENDYNVGSYTSPHLIEFNERIKINKIHAKTEEICEAFEIIEKFRGTNSSNDLGLYHYNFCLDTTNYLQPSGAMNLNRFKTIEFEMTTIVPNVDPDVEHAVLCDADGGVIAVTREEPLYLYTYDMHLFEERYNVLRFISGNAGLLFAR